MKYNQSKWGSIKPLLILLYAWVLIVVGGVALAQSGGGYTIKLFSIDGGAATSSGGGYTLRGTIGQPNASLSVLSGGGYNLRGGITQLPAPIIIPLSGASASPIRNYFIDPNVRLSWSPVTYATGYWVQVARDKNFTPSQIVKNVDGLPASQLVYIAELLGNGNYYWHVRAKVSATRWGNWSVTESFTVGVNQSFPTITPTSNGGVCPSTAFTCPQLFTCQEAYACLAAGNFSLDPDNDGIPCEDAPLMCS
jgi:hypothetical protein